MNHSTSSILQRVPAILAVTAASYGLPLRTQESRSASTISGPASRAASGCDAGRTPREAAATRH
ncbi:MAG TPA: hypothetical protein VLI46_14270 [Ramlibacter sp.]|nr:hypothetical protein [Ramlibacter sp.]